MAVSWPLASAVSWFSNQLINAAKIQAQITDPLNDLNTRTTNPLNPPMAMLYQTTAQPIPNAAFTAITWDTEVVDTHNGHDLVTNPSRYTAPVAGWYHVEGQVSWAPNATGRRIVSFFVNGAELGYLRGESVPTATAASSAASDSSGKVFLNVGDYIEVRAFQSSTAALNTAVTPTNLHIMWLRGA
jgi:hypothetical protein